ncbi:MAG: DNA methyltransferase [Treponema sp.]
MKYLNFDNISVNKDWAFDKVRSIEQWTHGYHRYLAKFLPNVVKKIIENYALPDYPVADPFVGCGTTLVEAKIHGFESYGVDINPVAELIAKVKTTPIRPSLLKAYYMDLIKQFTLYAEADLYDIKKHDRLDYWFDTKEKYKIIFIYSLIYKIDNHDIRDFFLVSLSHILKNCSKLLQSSTKPQIDKYKKPSDPFVIFKSHIQMVMQKNKEYYNELAKNNHFDVLCDIQLGDARNTKWADNSIGTIIISPPYVTSYEYADIH